MDFMEGALLKREEQEEFCKLISSPAGRLWRESGIKGTPTAEWLVEHDDFGGLLQRAVLFEWKGFMRNAPVRFIELTLHKHLCLMLAGKPNRCMSYHILVFATVLYASDSSRSFSTARLLHEGSEKDVSFFEEVWLDTTFTLLQEMWRGEFNQINAPRIVETQTAWLASTWLERDQTACIEFTTYVNEKIVRCVSEANMTQMFKKEQKQLKNTARNEHEKKIWSRFYDGDTEFLRQVFTNSLRDQLKPRKKIINGIRRRRTENSAVPQAQFPPRGILEECAQYATEIGLDPADIDQM